MSFGFSVPAGGARMLDERSEDGYPIRELMDIELYEVSPVTFPAYPDTSLSARSIEAINDLKEAERVRKLSLMQKRLDLHKHSM